MDNGLEETIEIAKKMAVSRGWDESSELLIPHRVPIQEVLGEFMKRSQDFSVEMAGIIRTDQEPDWRAFNLLASPRGNLYEYIIDGRSPATNVDTFFTPWSCTCHGFDSGTSAYISTFNYGTPATLVFFRDLPIWGELDDSLVDLSSSNSLTPVEAWIFPIGFTVVYFKAFNESSSQYLIIDNCGRYLVYQRKVTDGLTIYGMMVSRAVRRSSPQNRPLTEIYREQ